MNAFKPFNRCARFKPFNPPSSSPASRGGEYKGSSISESENGAVERNQVIERSAAIDRFEPLSEFSGGLS